jgi:hypothetical protein
MPAARRAPSARRAPPARRAPEAGVALRLPVILLGGAGAIGLALSFTALTWYSRSGTTLVAGTFGDLRDVTSLARIYGLHAPLILRAYFSWLALAAFIVAVALVGATAAPRRLAVAARVAAPIAGATGVALTCWAMQDLSDRVTGRSGITVFTNASVGLWACLLGFAALGLSGAIGLRRR